jgi:hypothetical protein
LNTKAGRKPETAAVRPEPFDGLTDLSDAALVYE